MSSSESVANDAFDVAIVGAGIVGLAHAWAASRRGQRVLVCERNRHAQGASIRNFGMVWPIGQPAGELHQMAMNSRAAWLELQRSHGLWVSTCGSLHLAHQSDEMAVLQEFFEASEESGIAVSLMTSRQVQQISPAANPNGLLGGLFSQSELCVDPRQVIRQLPGILSKANSVRFEFSTPITHVDESGLRDSTGRRWPAKRVVVCSGDDFKTLFPEVFAQQALRRCKLQMLRTVPQPDKWRMGPHLASGLTLRHYQSFECCPSLASLKDRIACETPELDQFGIHVMASQNESGHVILGDSHEYEDQSELTPFESESINQLILRELQKIICLPNWEIEQSWHGTYAKHRQQPVLIQEVLPNVTIATATGGAGMTMSFGLAEKFWELTTCLTANG